MQVIALADLLSHAAHAALDRRMTLHGFCGVPERTLRRVRARGVLSPAAAERLLAVARRVIAPDVVGIAHARGVYYDAAALVGLRDRVAEAEADAQKWRRIAWRWKYGGRDFPESNQTKPANHE